MKLKSLNNDYLSGVMDDIIDNYHNNNSSIPSELEVGYHIENEKFIDTSDWKSSKYLSKITFSWNSRSVYKEEETNFAENKRSEDYFTISAGSEISELRTKVESILYRLT